METNWKDSEDKGSSDQIQAGYPVIQTSGKEISFAPFAAASSIRAQVFLTAFSRSSHSGSACVTATLIVVDAFASAIVDGDQNEELETAGM